MSDLANKSAETEPCRDGLDAADSSHTTMPGEWAWLHQARISWAYNDESVQ